MDKIQKEALQVTKELIVKFIEAGRVSPSNLGEVFSQTYSIILETITSSGKLEYPQDPENLDKNQSKKSSK